MAAAESLGRRVLDLDSSGQVDSSEASLELPVSTSADDIALILYTSGTTGRPKGACLSHSSVAWIAEILALRVIRATSADVLLGVLPLSHIFGLIAVLSVSVVSAAQVVLEERFDAVRALNTIEEYGVTIFEGVPAMCPALLDAQAARGGPPPSTLRLAFLGGQSTPVEILRRFEATFRCNVIESYGTTETGSAITATPASGLDDSFVGTVGRPLRGVSVKILGEGGQELGAGEVGEIVVQSVGTMARYHGNDEATALVLRDGWFRTGDLGRRDERDVITVVDRKKEVILRRGYNVYPREVEEVLYEHPAVAEAAVIGVDDGSGGEEVAAVVAVKTGSATDERELREFVRSRVASYKYPRIVAIVDALPKNSTGKISKKAIDRQQIVEMSGAQLAENPRGENSESSTQRQSRWKG